MNYCSFIGNLGKDPEIRQTQSGETVANLSLAVSEKWTDKSGQKQERTEWVRVVVWGKLADICEKYLKKGSQVFIAGKLQTQKWTDKSGNDRYTTEIVVGFGGVMQMLDSREERPATPDQPAGGTGGDDLSDSIPF